MQTSWQATLFAAACAAVLYALRSARSSTRYRVLTIGGCLLPLLAVATGVATMFDAAVPSHSADPANLAALAVEPARIRAERENCCDDVAASQCGDVCLYVRALAELERLRAGGARRIAAGLCACVVLALVLVGTRAAAFAPLLAAQRLTMFLHAEDPAGEFTITLKGARVVAASMDRMPVPPARLRQTGNNLEFLDDAGTPTLEVSIVQGKGIHWTPRQAP